MGRKTQKFSVTNQKSERWRPFGTGLVRHCPQGLFSPFFTFLRAIFFRPFSLSLAHNICPWVSEDGWKLGGCETRNCDIQRWLFYFISNLLVVSSNLLSFLNFALLNFVLVNFLNVNFRAVLTHVRLTCTTHHQE